jgi:uncharacterized membrane protein
VKFRPVHGVAIVGLVMAAVLVADYAIEGGFSHSGYRRVGPGEDGMVRVDVAEIRPLDVKFYRFLNPGNQEVKFMVGRDEQGVVHVAFDASENDYKQRRGFRHDGEWIVNNKCETAVRLRELSVGGGCRPVPIAHRLEGDQLVLAENDILTGWRFFH